MTPTLRVALLAVGLATVGHFGVRAEQAASSSAQDPGQSVEFYRKGAEQGIPAAQYCLGVCYANGAGVDKDLKQAAKWYRKAAERGLPEAQYALGICFANGTGVERDLKEAEIWLRMAANQGNDNAQSALETVTAIRSQGSAGTYGEASAPSLRKTDRNRMQQDVRAAGLVSSAREARQLSDDELRSLYAQAIPILEMQRLRQAAESARAAAQRAADAAWKAGQGF